MHTVVLSKRRSVGLPVYVAKGYEA